MPDGQLTAECVDGSASETGGLREQRLDGAERAANRAALAVDPLDRGVGDAEPELGPPCTAAAGDVLEIHGFDRLEIGHGVLVLAVWSAQGHQHASCPREAVESTGRMPSIRQAWSAARGYPGTRASR